MAPYYHKYEKGFALTKKMSKYQSLKGAGTIDQQKTVVYAKTIN